MITIVIPAHEGEIAVALKAHPNVQFHFTPTSASWLNQVEVWFSILQGQSLSGTSFTSLKQLQEHIDAYVNAYVGERKLIRDQGKPSR